MQFAMFAGSDYEALEPIVELEQAKCMMEMMTDAANRQGSEDEGERVVSVGDWWMEGGMSVIDVGETTLWCILARRLRARNLRNDNVLIMDYGIRDIRPLPRIVCPKKIYDDLLAVNTECSYMHAM
jgi:hypothetical protein